MKKTSPRFKSSEQRPLWQKLVPPMLFLSLGLHGALLFIPIASSDDAVIPPPDPEQDNIAITRIPPAAPVPPSATASSSAALSAPAQIPLQTNRVATNQATAQRRTTPPQSAASSSRSARTNRRVERRSTERRSTERRSSDSSSTSRDNAVPDLPRSSTAANPNRNASPPNPGPVTAPLTPDPNSAPSVDRQRLLAYIGALEIPQAQLTQLSNYILQRFSYQPENTSQAAYEANRDIWLVTARQNSQRENLWNSSFENGVTVQHQRRVCFIPDPQAAVVGAVVSPAGQLMGAPTLLQSTGYSVLNTKAIEAIANHDFPATDDLKAYTVEVQVQVDYGELDCLKPQSPSTPPDAAS